MATPFAAEEPLELDPRGFADRLQASGLLEEPGFREELELCREAIQGSEANDSSPGDGTRELPHDVDAQDLAQAGWGVIYAAEDEDIVRWRLRELLDHRKRQAGVGYREIQYSPGQLARQFLWDQQEVAPGTIDPGRLPYYLLLVGGPEKISFDFQCQLSISHAVGRVCFDDVADYERYAEGIVAAEEMAILPRPTHLFSVENGDKTTRLLAEHLVRPLEGTLSASSGRELVVWRHERASKQHLAQLLGGQEPPGLFLASCHGKRFSAEEEELQKARQGALICQDWVPKRGPSTEQEYFHAGDLGSDMDFGGLIAFIFACFGAGTPVEDHFPHETQKVPGNRPVRPGGLTFEPFVARLPQALLVRGASAVVGHVDRGWTSSFSWRLGGRSQTAVGSLSDSLGRLLAGSRLGHALRPLYRRYTALAANLVVMLERLRYGEAVNESQLANLWTAHNDARNFIILGDPAARLPGWEYRQQEQWASFDPELESATISNSKSSDGALPTTNIPRPQAGDFAHDLEILVFAEGSPPALTYWLTSPSLGLNQREYGPVQLELEPQSYFERFFRDVKIGLRDRSRAHQRLTDRGAHLAQELLPADLMQTLWQLRGRVKTVRIQSQETWIPWELLKLEGRSDEDDSWLQGPFLCEAFALTRWRHQIPEQFALPLTKMALIASSSQDLPAVVEERQALLAFVGPERQIQPIPANRSDVLERMATGGFDGWHFTGHGIAPPGDVDHWAILLDDDSLTPASLHGEVKNLGLEHPLVFLNACHSGRGAMSLTGAGGWAAKLLEVGAGAFIGTSWPVTDRSAKMFAEEFYRRFFAGLPIGEAVFQARLHLRDRFPGDPSWLAYAVFAHPKARCMPVDGPSLQRVKKGLSWASKPEEDVPLSDESAQSSVARGVSARIPSPTSKPQDRSSRQVQPPRHLRPIAAGLAALAVLVMVWILGGRPKEPVPKADHRYEIGEATAEKTIPDEDRRDEIASEEFELGSELKNPPQVVREEQSSQDTSSGVSTAVRERPVYDVILLIDSAMAGGEIRIDGRVPVIVEDGGTVVRIRVNAKDSNHHIEVLKGERVCSKEIWIDARTPGISLSC